MNRLDDLVETMQFRIDAANKSPPVEIAIVDYNSTDGMEDYMRDLMASVKLVGGSFWTYRKYTGRNYYHAAHANNLALLLGQGEYVVAIPADVFVKDCFLPTLRSNIAEGCVWCTTTKKHKSSIAVRKDEFIASGGYDERFEFYGPDDRDIIKRLERRGSKYGEIYDSCLESIYTPPEKKVANYRITSMTEMKELLMPIYNHNKWHNVMVANEGLNWGSWE